MKQVALSQAARIVRPNYQARIVRSDKDDTGNNLPHPPSPFRGGIGGGDFTQSRERKMIKPDLATLLVQAESLSPDDQRQLMARLSLASKTTASSNDPAINMWAGAILTALEATLGGGDRGLPGVMVIARLLSGPNAFAPVKTFLAATKMDQLTVLEQSSVYGMLARLTCKYASEVANRAGIPLTAKLVVNCSASIAGIFDEAFPGYLANGLALMVARRHCHPATATM